MPTSMSTGRRREPPQGLTTNMLIRCAPEMREAVEAAADIEGRTMAAVCREAINTWLAQHPDLTPNATNAPAATGAFQRTRTRAAEGGDPLASA